MIALAKELRRKTRTSFMHYRKPVIVELVPGDVIRLRLCGQRVSSSVSIDIHDLYYDLVRRKAFRERMERAKARKAKKRHAS